MRKKMLNENGFTFIEILTVVIIIGVLAAIIAPRFFGRTEQARVAAAESQVNNISVALDAYELDNGSYPTTEQGMEALVVKPSSPPVPQNWRGPYLKKKPAADPWGNEYLYVSPGNHNTNGYDLSSYGKDGREGGEGDNADITNW